MQLTLTRKIQANGAVVGVLTGLSVPLYTLEDQWRDNKPSVSCIPTGAYEVRPHGWEINSPFKYNHVWQIHGVSGRSAILIHSGNTHKDTEGCILVGMSTQITQLGSLVGDSRMAIELMRTEIGQRPFTIVVEGQG